MNSAYNCAYTYIKEPQLVIKQHHTAIDRALLIVPFNSRVCTYA